MATTAVKERNPRIPEEPSTHRVRGDFPAWVQAHGSALRSYCRSLAGSPWEGDDLAQDTWLKIWSAARSKGEAFRLTRTYLFRTARHAWIDRRRKKVLPAEPYPMDELPQKLAQTDPAALWAAMETLVSELAPIQRTALLLIDILQYTAAEAAELVQSTEGAVKAALHRARVKLRKAVTDSARDKQGALDQAARHDGEVPPSAANEALVYAYMDAIRRQDAAALALLLNDVRPQDMVPVLTLQSYRRDSQRSLSGSQAAQPIQSRLIPMSFAHAA